MQGYPMGTFLPSYAFNLGKLLNHTPERQILTVSYP